MINLRTRAQKIRYALATQRLTESIERGYRARLHAEFRRVAREAAGSYPGTNRAIKAHRARLSRLLHGLHLDVATQFAHRYQDEKGKAAPLRLETKRDPQSALYTRIAALALARGGQKIADDIANATKLRIAAIISTGLGRQDHPTEIARTIRNDIDAVALSRANTIARTETHVAAMTGEVEAVSADVDVMTKEWIATNDDRTREEHAAADGQTIGMDESFDVGGDSLAYPGDPDGSAAETINCRCVLVYSTRPA